MNLPLGTQTDQRSDPGSVPTRARRSKLLQVLGVSFGVAVLVGNTILIGILRTPGDVAALLPSPALFIGVWVVGGIYALLGAALARRGRRDGRRVRRPVPDRTPWARRVSRVRGRMERLALDLRRPIALGAMVVTEYLEPLVPA